MRNIQTYNAPGPRRYIGINLWGLGGGRPTRLYIRSDRVEYLALLCPVHISALPPLCLFHPPSRRPLLATDARCSFLRLRFVCFCLSSKLRLARYECFIEQELLFSEADECLPRNVPFEFIKHNARLQKRENELCIECIFHNRLRNFTDEYTRIRKSF